MDGFSIEAFAAQRDRQLLDLADRLRPLLAAALDDDNLTAAVLDVLADPFRSIYEDEGGRDWQDAFALLRGDLEGAMQRTTPDSSPDRMATWLATALVNRATIEASPLLTVKRWVTMRDDDVRDIHRPLDGVRRLRGETFPVGGFALHYPGQPVGPPEVWINCRCVIAALPFTNISDAFALEFAEHDVLFLENRRTPKVVPRGKKYTPKPSEGRIVKRRKATKDEEKTIAKGDWLRVAKDGKKPSDPGYKRDNPSKIRPNLAQEDTMADTDVMERTDEDVVLDDDFEDDEGPNEATPWYGVLAPEGVPSGDGRSFDLGALSNRDLPLPLLWQPSNSQGHDGAVVVGQITSIDRDEDSVLWGAGTFAQTEDADKVVGLIADGHLRGISVDVDDAEMAVTEDDTVRFSKGRISAATIVPIPAFAEAFIALGVRDDLDDLVAAVEAMRDYDRAERDRMAGDEAMPDGSFPIRDKEDLRNAIQAVGRAKDYDAAKRHIIKRARALDAEDMLPDEWAGDVEEFKRGRGWVTHPSETRRLHNYWTRGPGAAKIRWGSPGDFTRCTRQLRKYINPLYLNRTCAEWHHDALGYWPGELGKPGNPPNTPENRRRAARHANALDDCNDCAQSVSLVAAAVPTVLPAEAFADPGFDGPTAMHLTADGRVYGHMALWDTCHVGIDKVCVNPPPSKAQYAYFATGQVLTDDGYVPVGQVTLGTGHADMNLDPFSTKAHYDNTGTAVADIAVGEDEHGIWFAGMLRDGVTAAQQRELLASPPSGDWRAVRGSLELIAVLAVNSQGFPVPRMAASAGQQTTLIAQAVLTAAAEPSVDIAELATAVVDEMHARSVRRQALLGLREFADDDRKRRAAKVREAI